MHGFEERINHLSDLLSNGKTRSLTLEQRIGHLLGTDMNLKWAPNIWDNFEILFATHQRFWWTQQWFMGYMAWAAFVSIHCKLRSPSRKFNSSSCSSSQVVNTDCQCRQPTHSPFWAISSDCPPCSSSSTPSCSLNLNSPGTACQSLIHFISWPES